MAETLVGRPFLDKTRESYLAAVKSWGRDALIAAFVLLMATLFVVVPYSRQSRELASLEGQEAGLTEHSEGFDGLAAELAAIDGAIDAAKQRIADSGKSVARDLAGRLGRFGEAVKRLRGGPESWMPGAEPFPGANMAEQFAVPNAALFELPPPATLADEFGLAIEEIALVTSTSLDDPQARDYERAREVVARVFHSEIDRAYADLGARSEREIAELRAVISTVLARAAPLAERFEIELPTADQIVPKSAPIQRPVDDALFRTREGKGQAITAGTTEVGRAIEAAAEPLAQLQQNVLSSRTELSQSLEAVQARGKLVQGELESLERGIEDLQGKLSQITAPLDWLPMDIARFVRFFPLLVALVFFLLTVRFARIRGLRRLLGQAYASTGLSESDVALAFYAPEATIDPFAGHTPIPRTALGGAGVLVVVTFLAVLAFVLWQVEAGEPAMSASAYAIDGLSIVLALGGCALLLGWGAAAPKPAPY